jgi:hypothetical protein
MQASPPQRGFGLIDMWMCGTQLPVSLSMLQYGYILYKMKNSHSQGKQFLKEVTNTNP